MIPNVHLFTVTRATPLFDVFFNRQVIFTGKCRRMVIEGPVINFEKYFFNAYLKLFYIKISTLQLILFDKYPIVFICMDRTL